MFEVKKICDRIYLISFKDLHQLCMHFLRYQEYYESPKFKHKSFELVDYIEWYSGKYGKGKFTYCTDWNGFNISSDCLFSASISDENRHDRLMRAIGEYLNFDANGNTFYIIGSTDVSGSTIKHEIAHGLYYVNNEYKDEVNCLFSMIESSVSCKINSALIKMGYDNSVIIDEANAYLSTGLLSSLADIKQLQKYKKPFQKLFSKYCKLLGIKLKG